MPALDRVLVLLPPRWLTRHVKASTRTRAASRREAVSLLAATTRSVCKFPFSLFLLSTVLM